MGDRHIISPITIKRADDEDDDTILDLQRQCLPSDEPLPVDKAVWWLAYDGDQPVAFAALSASQQEAQRGYLSRAGVLPSHRGLGLQKRLIRVRVREARRLGYKDVVSDCVAENVASANSLISCGFRPFVPAYRWGFERSIYWRKPLEC